MNLREIFWGESKPTRPMTRAELDEQADQDRKKALTAWENVVAQDEQTVIEIGRELVNCHNHLIRSKTRVAELKLGSVRNGKVDEQDIKDIIKSQVIDIQAVLSGIKQFTAQDLRQEVRA